MTLLVLAPWMSGLAPASADDPPTPTPTPTADEAAKPATPPAADPAAEKKPALTFHNEELIERADGTVVYFYRTNFAVPKSIIGALTAMNFDKLPGLIAIRELPGNTNQLVVEGESDVVEMVLDVLQYFDVAQPQVFIEAKVIEITYDSNFEFGLDYLHDRAAGGPNTFFRGASAVLNPPSFLRSGFPPGFPFQGSEANFGFAGQNALDFGAFALNYQALQIQGKAEVLSKPSIIATQGVKAMVTTEESTPIAALATAATGNVQFRSQIVKTGVKLEVTPSHIGEQFVTLSIVPEVKGAAALAASRPGGTFAPIETLRSANTTVTLRDGETLVIGGLYTNTSTSEKAKTPFFSDLPLLGDLFTRSKETKQKTELIFILTPHIVRKTSDLNIVVPPKELERLEGTNKDDKDCCDKPLSMPKLCLPKPPGWGAQLLDEK